MVIVTIFPMRRAFIALLTALPFALAPLPASAQSISAADARAVREVIEAQLDAFRQDDGPRAFSYAAPGIRETFATPENFMTMVRTQYAVVYRPRSVSFDAPMMAGDQLVQPVRMTDAEGHAWIALYPMEKQPDGTWRINGCQLGRLPARET
jgi:uncharacterized protein DUF4864